MVAATDQTADGPFAQERRQLDGGSRDSRGALLAADDIRRATAASADASVRCRREAQRARRDEVRERHGQPQAEPAAAAAARRGRRHRLTHFEVWGWAGSGKSPLVCRREMGAKDRKEPDGRGSRGRPARAGRCGRGVLRSDARDPCRGPSVIGATALLAVAATLWVMVQSHRHLGQGHACGSTR